MKNLIAMRIKEIRNDNGLSQSEFGKRIAVSQDTVSLWEQAKSLPTTEFVISIAKTYNVSSDFILGLKDY